MSTNSGRLAENAAAKQLRKQGYKIIEQNWRTRWCEIDIVAQKDGSILFIEVKYRKSKKWGSGLEYITPAKLRQMKFAAEFWAASNTYGGNYELAAIEVSGPELKVGELVADIN